MNSIHLFEVYSEIFPVSSYDKTSKHSKWMDNLNVDWSSGWILSCFFGCEGKIHKPKPWINQACKEIDTATLGMKLTSVVCKLEIKINLSKSKVKLHPYSKSISTTKCVISPLFKINSVNDWWCSGLHTQFTWWRNLVHVLAGGAYRFGVGARFHIWWCILILNKGEITHLVVDMNLE